jgi:YHS domain-containing protein
MNRLRKIVLAAFVVGAAGLLVGCGREAPESAAPAPPEVTEAPEPEATITQTVCPVMGGEIDEDIYVDHGGRRIYFCCPGCPEQFNKDPEKYLEKLRASQAPAEQSAANRLCPVMGNPVREDLFTVYEGRKVYFCCPGCKPTFEGNPQKYAANL